MCKLILKSSLRIWIRLLVLEKSSFRISTFIDKKWSILYLKSHFKQQIETKHQNKTFLNKLAQPPSSIFFLKLQLSRKNSRSETLATQAILLIRINLFLVSFLEWFHSSFHPTLFVFRRFQLSKESNHPRLKNFSKLRGSISVKWCKVSFESVKGS